MCICYRGIICYRPRIYTQLVLFTHIRKLNTAMDCIAQGNFDYVLPKDEIGGEIGELFKSYEDMRLRLKENSEDTLIPRILVILSE
mgnify:CR=1 FL=1